MNKRGRPTDMVKDTTFQVRINENTLLKLKYLSMANKTNCSDIVRQGIELMYAFEKN